MHSTNESMIKKTGTKFGRGSTVPPLRLPELVSQQAFMSERGSDRETSADEEIRKTIERVYELCMSSKATRRMELEGKLVYLAQKYPQCVAEQHAVLRTR
jgi:hypothetical protein